MADTGPPQTRLARSAAANLVGQALPVLAALLTMPVVVRGLGPASFGTLALAWTVIGYVAVFDLGFGRATTKRVSEAYWSGDLGRIRRWGAAAAGAQLLIGVATAAAVWVLSPALAQLLLSGNGAAQEGTAVLRSLAWGVPAVLLTNAHRAVLEGLQRFDLVNAARAPLSIAMFVVPLVGVVLDWSLPTIVAGLALTRWVGAGVFYLLYERTTPAGAGLPSVVEFRDLLRFGGWVGVSNAIIPFSFHLERFVVSAVGGPATLAYYAAPHELIWKLQLVPAAIGSALFPAFSGLATSGRRAELQRRLGQGVRLIVLLIVPPALTLVLTAEPLLGVWLGRDYAAASAWVLRILAAAVFLNALAFIPFVLIEGVGRPDTIAKYHLVELPLYGGLLLWLVSSYGILGAAAAAAVRMLVMAGALAAAALHHAELNPAAALSRATRRSVAAAGGFLLGTQVLAAVMGAGWSAVAAAALVVPAFLLLAWHALIEAEDRAAVRTLWKRVRQRGRSELPPARPDSLTLR